MASAASSEPLEGRRAGLTMNSGSAAWPDLKHSFNSLPGDLFMSVNSEI